MSTNNQNMMNPMMQMMNPYMMDPMFLGMQIPLGGGKINFNLFEFFLSKI